MPLMALALTVILWASAFAAIREAVATLGWQHLTFLRLAGAAVGLGFVALVRRAGGPARRDLPLLELVALTGKALYQVFLTAGEALAGVALMARSRRPAKSTQPARA